MSSMCGCIHFTPRKVHQSTAYSNDEMLGIIWFLPQEQWEIKSAVKGKNANNTNVNICGYRNRSIIYHQNQEKTREIQNDSCWGKKLNNKKYDSAEWKWLTK